MNAMRRLKTAMIVGTIRVSRMSPSLRRALVGILNRVPKLKRRLKRATVAAMAPRGSEPVGHPQDDAMLSPCARRVLRDLRCERARLESGGERSAGR